MSLPKYGNYKLSGIDWLPKIPAHWDVCALKRVASLQSGETITAEQIENAGAYPVYGGNGLRGFTTAFTHEGRFALIGRQGALCGNVNYSQGKFWASEHAVVATPLKRVNTTWLGEMLRAMNLNQYSVSAAQPGLSVELISRLAVPHPPLDEQTAIAAFLDRETAKIDALIAEQERLIELLAEKRQATISHAVTKGLNPDASMKDSGVAWLGEVPAHWDVCTVRRVLMRIEQGWSPECFSRPAEGSEWGVLKTGCVNGGTFNSRENKALPDTLKPDPSIEVCDGDLLMSRASGSPALVGAMAYVSEPPPRLMLSDKTFRLHLRQGVLSRFFAIVFGSRYMRLQIEQAISGAEGLANNLPQSSLKGFRIAIPPEPEQVKLTTFVETETGKLRTLSSEAERAIALLKERRSALIAAAVTGQIDVRGAIPQAVTENHEAIAA
jgi:type I restriction enzyme S subunit